MKELPFTTDTLDIYGTITYIDPKTHDIWVSIFSPADLHGEVAPLLATPETPHANLIFHRGDEVSGKARYVEAGANKETRLRISQLKLSDNS